MVHGLILGVHRILQADICFGHLLIRIALGQGTKIPVIVSKANGGFYISETTTAYRNKNKEKYVAIADHIHNDFGFQTYTKGEKYDTLKKAYEAYSKLLKEGKYSEYKYTLPK